MVFSSDEILLLKEYKGEIKNYFEENLESIWSLDNLVIEYPYKILCLTFGLQSKKRQQKVETRVG